MWTRNLMQETPFLRTLGGLAIAGALTLGAAALSGCDDPDGPLEEAAENIEEGAEEMREGAEDAAEEAGDNLEEAGEEIEDATKQ